MSQKGAEKTEMSANRAGHKIEEWDYINESHYQSPARDPVTILHDELWKQSDSCCEWDRNSDV